MLFLLRTLEREFTMLTIIKKLHIKTKLVLIILFISVTGLILEGTAFNIYQRFQIKEEIRKDVSLLARIIGNHNIAPLAAKNHAIVKENLTEFKAKRAIVAASIYDAQGDIFARYDSGEEPAFDFPDTLTAVKSMPTEENYLYVNEPIMDNGTPVGNLLIRASVREVNAFCQNFMLFSTLIIFVTSIVLLIIATCSQYLILNPFENLILNIQTIIHNKDYRIRIESKNNDTFGMLISTFNNMLDTIENYERALLQSNQRLATFEQSTHYPPELLALESLQVGEGIQRVAGKVDDYRKQLQRFREHYASATQELKRLLLSEKNIAAGEDFCNTLKSVTGNIGAKALYQQITTISTQLKQSQLPDAVEFEKLQILLQAVIEDIDSLSLTKTTTLLPKDFAPKVLLEKIAALLFSLENDLGQTETLLAELHAGMVGSEFETLIADIAIQIDVFNTDKAATLLTDLQQRLSMPPHL